VTALAAWKSPLAASAYKQAQCSDTSPLGAGMFHCKKENPMSSYIHVLKGLTLVFVAIFIISCNNKKNPVVSLWVSDKKGGHAAFFEASRIYVSNKSQILYVELAKKEKERFYLFAKENEGKTVEVKINSMFFCSVKIVSSDDLRDGHFHCGFDKIDKEMMDLLRTLGVDWV